MNEYNVYYSDNLNGSFKVYIIPNHYGHSLGYIKKVLAYAKTITAVPIDNLVTVEVLSGEKYKNMLSLEFDSTTKPKTGMLLAKDSPIWSWLKY